MSSPSCATRSASAGQRDVAGRYGPGSSPYGPGDTGDAGGNDFASLLSGAASGFSAARRMRQSRPKQNTFADALQTPLTKPKQYPKPPAPHVPGDFDFNYF